MTRRTLFQRLTYGLPAAFLPGTATLVTNKDVPIIEPVPTQRDFAPVGSCHCDCSTMVVSDALAKLGWQSGLAPWPLLIVNPAAYSFGLSIAGHFGGALHVLASDYLTTHDMDTWFVAWRGRRVGSIGA